MAKVRAHEENVVFLNRAHEGRNRGHTKKESYLEMEAFTEFSGQNAQTQSSLLLKQ